MAMQYFHQAILGRKFQLLNPLFFELFLGRQVQLVPKGFQLLFELLMFEINGFKFIVLS
jgi:hypothetical protein